MPRTKAPDRLLTEVELELMNIVWELGGGTVADVIARLPPERPLAYTSVATMLRILEQNGVLVTGSVRATCRSIARLRLLLSVSLLARWRVRRNLRALWGYRLLARRCSF